MDDERADRLSADFGDPQPARWATPPGADFDDIAELTEGLPIEK